MYPLRFDPIYQYRLWGGRRLAHWLDKPLPGDGPIGEAWLLSDRDDHASKVANGPLEGSTIQQLLTQAPESIYGKLAGRFPRFPLLLKFLDATQKLSVQVHPNDSQTDEIPPGESGKTESWVVLQATPDSRIFAGLQPHTTPADLEKAVQNGTVPEHLSSFTPKVGDAILITAGTVHTLNNVVVFETQQNSDVTFRLYDWNHTDPKTGKPRPLQVQEAMACVDFDQTKIIPTPPVIEQPPPTSRERLLNCDHFTIWRHVAESRFSVGAVNIPRVLVIVSGEGTIEYSSGVEPVHRGNVFLLPAELGVCTVCPQAAMMVLEVALPDGPTANPPAIS
jgi:mannose-6-phosphate isomerase